MEELIYSSLSEKKLTKVISCIISRTLLDMTRFPFFQGETYSLGFRDIGKDYKGIKLKAKLIQNMGHYKIGEYVAISIDKNDIVVKSTKLTREKKASISYKVHPELPTIKQIKEPYIFGIPVNAHSYSTNLWDVELFFRKGNFEYDPNYISQVMALRDFESIKKGKIYYITIMDKGIQLYDNKKEFLCYLTIDYRKPLLIENKEKL